ncbi:endonuclease/exonuclease/phosphatase family protein [Chelativorans sp.]|uniref:endonuclease/exonuclease/phosphatase family protein n=1 Tax=Chelativorans sp. TaxID=2203393 RepID=UPI002811186F|nr:endonuclease/exonuclease/phosphatase family protein [Chelativorans sp.]
MVLALLLSAPLVLGFLKTVHPAFDSFAHFRAHLAVLLALASLPLLFFRPWRAQGLLAFALAGAALTTVFDPTGLRLDSNAAEPARPAAIYRLLHLNLRYDNSTPKKVLSLIGRSDADVVTLNEVSGMWVDQLAFTGQAYPYRLICPHRARTGGVAILSRRPFLHSSRANCHDRGSLAVATINFSGTAVDIVALHLAWPWPFEQAWQIGSVTPVLERLGSTAVLAGDFNAAPWSNTAQRLAEAGGFWMLRNIGPTWLKLPLPHWLRRIAGLPIDNIFVKGLVEPLATKRLETVGSDHLPVLLEFSLRPKPATPEALQASLGE